MPARYRIRGRNASQIAESIEREIDRGGYAADDPLPTIRELAAHLDVSPTTVNAAYAELRKRGRIGGNRRGGSRVIGRPVYPTAASPIPVRRGARDLIVANPDPALLPPLRPFVEGAVREGRLYGKYAISPRLEAVARRRLHDEGIDATHLATAGGAVEAVERALCAHLVAGDAVALEDPGYPQFRELCAILGLRTIPLAVDALGVVPDALRAALRDRAKAVVVIPRAQNPTGASFDAARAQALRRVLDDVPATLVIEDDSLGGFAQVPLHSLSAKRSRWIYIRSHAKVLGPDLRCAVFAGDALTMSRIEARAQTTSGPTSMLLQETLAAMLADRPVRRAVARAARAYGERREALVVALRDAHIPVAPGDSGFSIWIPVEDEVAAARVLDRAGYAVDGGARYRLAAPAGIRIVTATLDERDCERIARALASLAGARSIAR